MEKKKTLKTRVKLKKQIFRDYEIDTLNKMITICIKFRLCGDYTYRELFDFHKKCLENADYYVKE